MKKAGLIIAYIVVTAAVLWAGGENEEQANAIRYGGQYYPGEFLLQGHDFFSAYDIDVEHTLFSSGTENNEALISGNVDVNVGSDSKTVALFSALGEKALIIGTVQRGNRYSTMVRPESEYSDWADLKGKKVGTRFGTGAEFVLRKYFSSRQDLSWEDFEWVNINPEDMIAALDNGQIEAFTVWAPTGEIAESQGVATLLKTFGDVALTPVSIHTTKAFAESHRDLLVRFLAAQLDKAEMIKNNPEQAAEYAATAATERGFDVSNEAFLLLFDRIDFRIEFDRSLVDEITETAEFLHSQGKINAIPEFYIDTSLLQDAQKLRAK